MDNTISRPAPWSPGYAKLYYTGAPVAFAFSCWIAAVVIFIVGDGPTASILGGALGASGSGVAGLWAAATRKARGMTRFAPPAYAHWAVAFDVVQAMEAVPELRQLSHETWRGLSEASLADEKALFNGLARSARALIKASTSRADALAEARRTRELLEAVITQVREQHSS